VLVQVVHQSGEAEAVIAFLGKEKISQLCHEHEINKKKEKLGEFHCLVHELQNDPKPVA